jgi:hypothetical protein
MLQGRQELTNLSIRADLGLVLAILLGGDGPVDEEEVDIVGLELLQGVLDGPANVLGTVEVVPDLGADENVLALDRGILLEEVADAIANLVLVLVEPGAVQVPVSDLEGLLDGAVGLTGGALAGEGTETNGGDGDAVAELEGLSARHGGEVGVVRMRCGEAIG